MSAEQKIPDMYLSLPHACSYLAERMATTLFVDPRQPVAPEIFSVLMRSGFRRSGDLIYRPHCQGCRACISVRIDAGRFQRSRGQARTWRKNQDLVATEVAGEYRDEHFALYRQYQALRHPGGGMDDPDPKKYADFLLSRVADTRLIEFRLGHGGLAAVAAVDVLADGLSAVYTFYDPAQMARGLGTYAILWQVEWARRLGVPWVYLGYWIRECPKMDYKSAFRPLQAYVSGHWERLS
jgi:arginine-tRNA-protein transferase